MKILFVLENFYPKIGGVETLFYNLTNELADRGHRVVVVTSGLELDNVRSEQLRDGITIKRLRSSNRYFFTFLSLLKIMKYAIQCDIIHTTSYNAGFPSSIAGFLTRKPVLITFHEYWGRMWYELPYMSKLGKWLHYIFEAFLLKLPFTTFVAVSKYTYKRLRQAGIKESKTAMIYNGLNYNEFNTIIPDHKYKRFVFYGRLGISKGIDLLIKSVSNIEDLKGFEFNLILSERKGEYLKELYRIRDRLKLNSSVKFVDTMPFDDLKKFIKESYAVVIPSYSEGFCFVAVETMALGIPVVSSGRGALSEVVSGQHLHFSPFSEEACTEALIKAINGEWNHTSSKKFLLNDHVDGYEKLYQSIV